MSFQKSSVDGFSNSLARIVRPCHLPAPPRSARLRACNAARALERWISLEANAIQWSFANLKVCHSRTLEKEEKRMPGSCLPVRVTVKPKLQSIGRLQIDRLPRGFPPSSIFHFPSLVLQSILTYHNVSSLFTDLQVNRYSYPIPLLSRLQAFLLLYCLISPLTYRLRGGSRNCHPNIRLNFTSLTSHHSSRSHLPLTSPEQRL